MGLIFTEASGSGSFCLLHSLLNNHDCFNIIKAMNLACVSKNHGNLKRLLKSSEIVTLDMDTAEKIARLSQDSSILCMLEKF